MNKDLNEAKEKVEQEVIKKKKELQRALRRGSSVGKSFNSSN